MNNLNMVINKFKMNLEEIINKLKKLQNNLDTYYNINNDILNNYEINKYKNYNLLKNLQNINKDIDNEIDKLRYKYSYGYNLNGLLYLYTEINDENLEIELQYKPINNNKEYEDSEEKEGNEKERLRIFGEYFIKNNINKCKIIYNDEEYDLCEYINDIDNYYNDIITIKLKGYNNITNMSSMFSDCAELSLLPDISKWDT